MMLPQSTIQRIAADAEKTFPVLHLTQNSEKNSRKNQRAYVLGATAEAEKAAGLLEALKFVVSMTCPIQMTKGNKIIYETSIDALTKYNNSK